MERFVAQEFTKRQIPILSGEYDHNEEHGECDLIVEVPNMVIFLELKKKALTRQARAGNDVNLLLDIAGSLLDAQAQAGWHEVRLTQRGEINLFYNGTESTIKLDGRKIEKIAVSMLDYGSFQDRIILKRFLEATLNRNFHPRDESLSTKFNKINNSLREITEQVILKYPGQKQVEQPFFNCWFISIPQLLVLMDGVTDASSFRDALGICRNVTMGVCDFYYELSHWRRIRASNTSPSNK